MQSKQYSAAEWTVPAVVSDRAVRAPFEFETDLVDTELCVDGLAEWLLHLISSQEGYFAKKQFSDSIRLGSESQVSRECLQALKVLRENADTVLSQLELKGKPVRVRAKITLSSD